MSEPKDIWSAIASRNLRELSEMLYSEDRHPINCICIQCDLRARLALEQRDEPRHRNADEIAADKAGSRTRNRGEL